MLFAGIRAVVVLDSWSTDFIVGDQGTDEEDSLEALFKVMSVS